MLKRVAFLIYTATFAPVASVAQSVEGQHTGLVLELNTMQEAGAGCRLVFLADNQTGTSIENAAFETVIFGTDGKVMSLSLFEFRDLPEDRPRVRQFNLSSTACNTIGRVLINGSSTCRVNGAESDICQRTLSLSSRIDVELLG